MEYNKFFSPQTLEKLNKQSAENLKTMLGDKTLMQTMISSQKLLDQIAKAEAPYKSQLEKLAVDLVKEIYPIIDREGINIEASLGDIKSVTSTLKEDESISGVSPEARRRIINGITQGAAIRGAFAFYLFKEHLDDLDPQLVEAYNQILKNSFGIYDDDNAIAMLLAALAQGHKAAGGSSQVVISEAQSSTIIIKANAINFPMLVHEIVKGLFELISLQGFKGDKQQNQAVANKVDKLENEPEDLQKGKFIYDALRNIGTASGAKNKTMPYFFTEVYKLDDEEFMDFVERAILDRLTDKQKRWAQNAVREIEDDMYEDDIDAID